MTEDWTWNTTYSWYHYKRKKNNNNVTSSSWTELTVKAIKNYLQKNEKFKSVTQEKTGFHNPFF